MSRFEEVTDRTGTRSVKWDRSKLLFTGEDILPMWVADMDFKSPQPVLDAISERAQHGIFGYTLPDDEVHTTIQNWLNRRHGWDIDTEWISYSPGVVPSLYMMIQAFTEENDGVLIQTPVYAPFFDVIKRHNRKLVTNELKRNDTSYEIDFEDFEEKIVSNDVKAFILCNPHNPVGRVWTEEELQRMADICLKHDVVIFSDEIHADIILPGHKHVPIATLSDRINKQTITCLSPTKTFNLAGLQASYIVTADAEKKKQLDEQFKNNGMGMLNIFGLTALEAAYQHGEAWLEELNETLESHRDYVTERFHKELEGVTVIRQEGTYLMWIDFSGTGLSHQKLKDYMETEARVGLNDGKWFGEGGEGFLRMNLACPRKTLEDGVERIVQAFKRL
ncbi:MalY/PatB family protein [Thalassobacillus hwangdonensis]|uniref:cysteine-S-conjugate beta-lyase n=1 Tax=Thalassobacillus hwangdonensis TaxID=546108 RepID=A0ABW3L4U3_9BACI